MGFPSFSKGFGYVNQSNPRVSAGFTVVGGDKVGELRDPAGLREVFPGGAGGSLRVNFKIPLKGAVVVVVEPFREE